MKKNIVKTLFFALCAAMTVALAACGHSTPSESDAKAAILSKLDGCPYLSLESFKKANGIPGDDPNSYRCRRRVHPQVQAD